MPFSYLSDNVIEHMNIFQLGFGTSSPVLSDKTRFPKFYRIIPPDNNKNTARIGLMEEFNWSKIATIHHSSEFFAMVCN